MKTAVTLCLIGMLAACGEKSATQSSSEQKPQASEQKPQASEQKPQASAATAKGTNSDAAAVFNEAQKKTQVTKPMPDLSVPLENYTALDQVKDKGATWLTYIAIAQSEKKSDDKELLNLFSGKYYNEPDAFKKQELISSELPPIKQLVDAYTKQRYYVIEFGQSHDGISPNFSISDAYDFDHKSFKINGGQACFNVGYGNQQQVGLSFTDASPALCEIKVEDIEMAKRLEQLRAARNAHLRGKIYFFVQGVEQGNQVKAIPTYVQYDVYDKPFYQAGGKMVTSVSQKAVPVSK